MPDRAMVKRYRRDITAVLVIVVRKPLYEGRAEENVAKGKAHSRSTAVQCINRLLERITADTVGARRARALGKATRWREIIVLQPLLDDREVVTMTQATEAKGKLATQLLDSPDLTQQNQ